MGDRVSAPRFVSGIQVATLVSVLLVAYTVGVVALAAAGNLSLSRAGLLLALPVVLATTVLRPEWTILIVLVLPPTLLTPVQAMTLVMVAAIFGFLVQGGVRLGPKTGVYPLIGIVVLAIVQMADVSADAANAADAMLQLIIYYTLLMLVAFNSAAHGRLHIDTVINALLLGLVGAAVLQPFFGASTSFEAVNNTPFRGQFAYLAVMGLGVSYVRLALRGSAHGRQSAFDLFVVLAFLCLAAIGFGRAAWIAGLWVFALVSFWTGRRSFWIVASVVLVLALTVPVVGERILPGGSADIGDPETLDQVTTGRSVLWEDIWERGIDRWALGQGWGFIWSLTPSDIFGFEGTFVTQENPFVFAHNDFLYVFVELGILGFGLLIAFWFLLFRKIRPLSGSRSESIRYDVRVLIPVIIVMFVVQLFDNGFAIRFVAERFFIAAGLVFAMQYSPGQRDRLDNPESRSPGTSQDIAALEG